MSEEGEGGREGEGAVVMQWGGNDSIKRGEECLR